MPVRIRPSPLAAGLSVTDLPILPFLAPRLLHPWPKPIQNRRSKCTSAGSQENGVEACERANAGNRSSQTRPRSRGGGRCLREGARTAATRVGQKNDNIHGAASGRRMYSTGATKTKTKNDVATDCVASSSTNQFGAAIPDDKNPTNLTPLRGTRLTREQQRELNRRKNEMRAEKDRIRNEPTEMATDGVVFSPAAQTLFMRKQWALEQQRAMEERAVQKQWALEQARALRIQQEEISRAESMGKKQKKKRKKPGSVAQSPSTEETKVPGSGDPDIAEEPTMEDLEKMGITLDKLSAREFIEKISRLRAPKRSRVRQFAIRWMENRLQNGELRDPGLVKTLTEELAEIRSHEDAYIRHVIHSVELTIQRREQKERALLEKLVAIDKRFLQEIEEIRHEIKEVEKDLDLAQHRVQELTEELDAKNAKMLADTSRYWELQGLPARRIGSWTPDEFPRFLKAWRFMNEAGSLMNNVGAGLEEDDDVRITQTFHHEWVHWFEQFRERLGVHKAKRPAEHKELEKELNKLVTFDPSLEVNEIRELWLDYLRWMEKDGSYERQRFSLEAGDPLHARRIVVEDSWPAIMLNILAERPQDGLKFLVATCGVGPLSHDHHYSDVIDFLVNYYMGPKALIARKHFDHLFDSIKILLTKYINAEVAISDFAVMKLFMNTSIRQAEALYAALLARGKKMGINTRLRVASTVGNIGASDVAVHILETLYKDGKQFVHKHITTVCATVLRGSQRDPHQKLRESEIFERFLHFGLKPTITFYNILAHNAVESGDHETAWKIYDMLLENGIEPSPHTFSILINDAKWRVDVEALERLTAEHNKRRIRNEHIANDAIHATWVIHEHMRRSLPRVDPTEKQELREKNWTYRTLKTYMHYFHLGPLLDLAPEVFSSFPDHLKTVSMGRNHGRKMHPDSKTMNLMITTALQCVVRTDDVYPLYLRYKNLLVAGHPDYVRLARSGTSIADAFISRLGSDPRTLPLCMNVMADVISSQETVPDDEAQALHAVNMRLAWFKRADLDNHPKKKLAFAKPGVRTWTVLMQAFLRQKQVRAAEKVMDMMKARGVKPDKVTWEHLVSGYFKAWDGEGTVNAIERAEAEGHEMTGTLQQRGLANEEREMGIMERVVRSARPGRVKWKRWVPGEQREGGEERVDGEGEQRSMEEERHGDGRYEEGYDERYEERYEEERRDEVEERKEWYD